MLAVATREAQQRGQEPDVDGVGLGVLDGEAVGELEQVERGAQPVEVVAQDDERLDGLGLRDDAERAAVREHDLHVGERLEVAGDLAARPQRALGEGVELAPCGREQGDDAVGLAEAAVAQHHRLGLRDGAGRGLGSRALLDGLPEGECALEGDVVGVLEVRAGGQAAREAG